MSGLQQPQEFSAPVLPACTAAIVAEMILVQQRLLITVVEDAWLHDEPSTDRGQLAPTTMPWFRMMPEVKYSTNGTLKANRSQAHKMAKIMPKGKPRFLKKSFFSAAGTARMGLRGATKMERVIYIYIYLY